MKLLQVTNNWCFLTEHIAIWLQFWTQDQFWVQTKHTTPSSEINFKKLTYYVIVGLMISMYV